MSRNSVIAAVIPPALLGSFYVWIAAVWMSVGRPPSVDYLPLWLHRWEFVAGAPLVFLIVPPGLLCVVLACFGVMPFRRYRGPAIAFLASSATVFIYLIVFDFGGWFRWFLD